MTTPALCPSCNGDHITTGCGEPFDALLTKMVLCERPATVGNATLHCRNERGHPGDCWYLLPAGGPRHEPDTYAMAGAVLDGSRRIEEVLPELSAPKGTRHACTARYRNQRGTETYGCTLPLGHEQEHEAWADRLLYTWSNLPEPLPADNWGEKWKSLWYESLEDERELLAHAATLSTTAAAVANELATYPAMHACSPEVDAFMRGLAARLTPANPQEDETDAR